MKKILYLLIVTFFISNLFGQTNNIKSEFKLKWKAKIGYTTYRTNIIFINGKIFIGSNGSDRNSSDDSYDGVYLISPVDGHKIDQFKPASMGDNDVNGVVIHNNRIYFGNDNFHFFCYSLDDEELWNYETPSDVESCPVLSNVNADTIPDVIFTIEGKGVIALDGLTGKEIWWFKTDRDRGYNGTPAVIDLNNDGINDVLIGGEGEPSVIETMAWKMRYYGDYFYALNGLDGSILWAYEAGSKIHASPLVVIENSDTTIIFSECYGNTYLLDKKGNKIRDYGLGIGVFASPVLSSISGYLAAGTSWFSNASKPDDSFVITDIDSIDYSKSDVDTSIHLFKNHLTNKISSTALLADILGLGSPQFIVCTENGEMLITEKNGTLLKRLKLPSGAEATPLIKDIDGDGFLEIIIACLDQNLYCFETKSKGKVEWGQFRGDNLNSGVMKVGN